VIEKQTEIALGTFRNAAFLSGFDYGDVKDEHLLRGMAIVLNEMRLEKRMSDVEAWAFGFHWCGVHWHKLMSAMTEQDEH